jgi:hypothetical protein
MPVREVNFAHITTSCLALRAVELGLPFLAECRRRDAAEWSLANSYPRTVSSSRTSP